MTDPARLLVVGDTHGDLGWVRNDVIPRAVDLGCTKIVQVGDFGFVWPGSWWHELARLSKMLDTAGIDLHFLPGNHEDHPTLARLDADADERSPEGHAALAARIFYTGRVSAWSWSGTRFAAVGGAPSIDRRLRTAGRDWWPEEVLSEEEHQRATRLGEVAVLFTHDAPSSLPVNGLIPDADSTANRQRLTDVGRALRPATWLHGHYHRYLQYGFRHDGGQCDVTSLDCNRSPRTKGTALLVIEPR